MAALKAANPLYQQIAGIKAKCRKQDIEFAITAEFVLDLYLANPVCPITLRRMLLPTEVGSRLDRLSVDRRSPKGGYTPDNIQLMSVRANIIKGDNTDPEMFERMASLLR
jgi:hypothetical protein